MSKEATEAHVLHTAPASPLWFDHTGGNPYVIPWYVDPAAQHHMLDNGICLIECSDGSVFTTNDIQCKE